MSQGVDRDVQGELLAVVRADAFALIARVVSAERAAEPILAHNRNQVALVKEPFQLDIPSLIQAADSIDLVKRTINKVIVRNHLHFFTGKNPAEFTSPRLGEIGIGAAAGGKKEPAMAKLLAHIFQFGLAKHKVIVPIHEDERCLEQIGISQFDFAFLLDLESGRPRDQAH